VGVIAVLVVVLVAGLAVAAYHLLSGGSHPTASGTSHHHATSQTNSKPVVLQPLSAQGLEENNVNANFAIDNSPKTAWQTHFYIGSPFFGGLQPASGLLLDMGRGVKLSSVTVTFGAIPGANVQIRLGTPAAAVPPPVQNPTNAQAAADQSFANAMTTVGQQSNVSGTVTFPVTSTAQGRYVLIWFTKLPLQAGQTEKYQAEIFNVIVKGTG
jgi:hypothetical protein